MIQNPTGTQPRHVVEMIAEEIITHLCQHSLVKKYNAPPGAALTDYHHGRTLGRLQNEYERLFGLSSSMLGPKR